MNKWQVKSPDPAIAESLARDTGWNPFICKILAGRNILNRNDAERFFNNDTLSDPLLMADMEKAVEIINSFIEQGEKITVYGDYDCDGITSTYMLFSYLEALGAEVDWYIPSRDEGYGLNKDAVELLAKRGTKLIITVDNGISAIEEAELIYELGMTLVITDHHQVPDELPRAAAIINPHRKEDLSHFRKIAGCGVVLKLICAMEDDNENALEEYAAFAAIGTVGDIVPLVDENRLIVRRGLEYLSYTENLGLSALIRQSGIDPDTEILSSQLAFALCPRINAAGRYAHPKTAMELLLAESPNVAKAKAEELNNYNNCRKQAEEEIIAAAEEQIRQNPDILNRKILIVSGEGWSHGIIGIASAKLLHKYGKPNIVITIEGDTARGSARSFDGLSLFEMLDSCKEHLVRFGGHTKAAGLTLETKNLDTFKAAVYDYCKDKPTAVEIITADLEIAPEDLTEENITLLERLEPFGEENPSPLFLFRNCLITSKKSLKDGKFVAFNFRYGKSEYRAVNFSSTFDGFSFEAGEYIDMLASVEMNEYNDKTDFKIQVRDIRHSGFNQDRFFAAKEAYENYRCKRADKALICRMLPEQTELKLCYDVLRKTSYISKAAVITANKGINYCKFRIVLDVFKEFGLIELDVTTDRAALIPNAPKADLTKSRILNGLRILASQNDD